jgi:hypothetical protein
MNNDTHAVTASRPNATSRFAFIVGAPRCGTTALANYLKQNPQVCFSSVKEPHYFSRHDLGELDDAALRQLVENEYLTRFFDHIGGEARIAAEGSVSYLYAPDQMAPILKLWPEAKFIIAVRDPLQMLPSLHARLLVTGDETILSFAKAWAMISERAAGRSIPRSTIDPRWLRYDEAGYLGTHVQRFFDAVGRDRCHVVLFDDLAADPQGTYRRMCAFLGIEPWDGTDFSPQRINKTIRIGWLQRLIKRPPKAIRTALAGEKFHQREKDVESTASPVLTAIFKVRARLLEWNKVPVKRQPLDPVLRERIIALLRDDLILLSRVIDRDLSHWLGGVPEAKS